MNELLQQIFDFNAIYPAELVEMKFEFMRENLFRFFRGTCHLFFWNWSRLPDQIIAPLVWICGDLHLENFGSYKGENRMVYFDLNDFDETVLAPVTWELGRTVCSILIASEALEISRKQAMELCKKYLDSYTKVLSDGKPYYIDARIARGIVGDFLKTVEKRKYKKLLRTKTGKSEKISCLDLDHPKHSEIPKPLKRRLIDFVNTWIQTRRDSPDNYRVIDAVFRVAGTGSIGLKRYAFLLKKKNKKEKYLLVDMKQVRPSSLTPFLKHEQPKFENDAIKVAKLQRLMQNVPPALISEVEFAGDLYIIQEMQCTKDYIDFSLLKNRPDDMLDVISDMGMLTASAHLRSSGRFGAGPADDLICFARQTGWHLQLIEQSQLMAGLYKQLYHQFVKQTSKKRKFDNSGMDDKVSIPGSRC